MNKLLIAFVFILLAGCYQFGKLSIRSSDNNQIEFYIDNETLAENNATGYYISDFGVAKDNCTSDCIVWEIVVNENSGATAVINNSFKYGVTPKDMEVRYVAKELTPGEYTGSGTIVFTGSKAGVTGMSMFVKFVIGKQGES